MLEARDLALGDRLRGVSAKFAPGAITAICGPNGAGKSTLLKLLAQLLEAEGGTIALDGEPLTSLSPRERAKALGYLPQEPQIAWDLSVHNLVALGRLPYRDADPAPVDKALTAMNLHGFAHRPVSTLSGGERSRALLARVIAGTPRYILADEPFASLDLAYQAGLAGHFRALAEQGTGIVVVVHDLALARNLADKVILLKEGRLAAEGSPEGALSAERIAECFGVEGTWHGAHGAHAFAITGS